MSHILLPPYHRRRRGSVLLTVVMLMSFLFAVSISVTDSTQDQIEIQLDGSDALKAALAAESGLEYAQRRLLLQPDWPGTAAGGYAMPDGSRFEIVAGLEENSEFGADVHEIQIEGFHGEGKARMGGGLRVVPGDGGTSDLALIVLAEDFTMTHGMVYGDVLLVDRAFKCDDWMCIPGGGGSYAPGHGPGADGVKEFVCTGVDGTVFKYREDLDDYQWLGPEVVISENAVMPSWDLDEFLQPGPGKVHLINPHNMGNEIWKLNGLTYEDTVVITLLNNQTVTLTNCHFNGGLVVVSPFAADAREGNSNLIHVKKGTTIGGGAHGAYPHLGLIAPGGNLKSDNDQSEIVGFTLVKDVDLFKFGEIRGQMVILNDCKNLRDCEITYVPEVGENLPPCFSFGSPGGHTDVLAFFPVFE
jgi:hypothetical protein